MKISAVIITFNEERNIGRCLSSLKGVAEEVVVVDSFSTDRTEEICREHGAQFFQHPFAGHIEQKNHALDLANFDHILALDADEALSDELRASIFQAKNDWQAGGYTMNRLTNYCGQWIRHSGWYPDRKLRLFDRRLGQWGGANPHDRMVMQPGTRVEHLAGDLLHFSYYTENEHLVRAKRYAEIAVEAMRREGRRVSWLNVWLNPAFKFFRNYVLKMGFLDGRAGFRICQIAALETFWKYRAARKNG